MQSSPPRRVLYLLLLAGLTGNIVVDSIRQKRVPITRSSQDVIPHSMPWLVIHLVGPISCSGSLISRPPNQYSQISEGSSDIILTAAHCIHGVFGKIRPLAMTVLLGKHNASGPEDSEQRFRVINVLFPPNYSYGEPTHDIAMLKLESMVKFNDFIKPIPLSNVAANQVESCLLAGWSDGENGLKAGPWGPNTVLRQLKFLTGKIQDGKLYYNNSMMEFGVNKGDSGTGIVCSDGKQLVLQGVTHGTSYDFTTGLRFIKFADVVEQAMWINDAFGKIDTLHMYHEYLEPNTPFNANKKTFENEVIRKIEGSVGYLLPAEFNRHIVSPLHNRSAYVDLWFQEKISEKMSIHRNRFNVQGIRGFSDEDSVYDCAVICYLENQNGSCSYISPLKHCYFSDAVSMNNKFLLRMEKRSSVNMQFGAVNDRALSDAPSFMGNKVPSWNSIGQNENIGSMMWNISVTVKGSFQHCEGLLSSMERGKYNKLHISDACLLFFRQHMIASGDHTLNIRVLQSATSMDTKVHFDTQFTNANIELIHPLSIQQEFPTAHGLKSQAPMLRSYDPYNGAFVTGPFACPWIAILRDFASSNLRACPAVLIDDQIPFKDHGTFGHSTKIILTTKTCMRKFEDFEVITDYLVGQESIYRGEFIVERIFETTAVMALASLDTPVDLNDFVHPIILPLERGRVFMEKLSLAIVSMKEEGVLYAEALIYQIPVKIHGYQTIDGIEMVLTQRLYKAAETPDYASVELGQGFLVGYDKSIGRHYLLGLNATTIHNSGQQHIEQHVLVEPHADQIQRAILNLEEDNIPFHY